MIDLLFTVGTVGFLLSDLKQFIKLRQNTFATTAISRWHLKLKLFSLACVVLAYHLSGLHLSLVVATGQLILNIGIVSYVYKYYNV